MTESALWRDKLILVGITGSIAAYKAVDLVRRLVERGARVRVLMTSAAQQFISPVTLRELSRAPVVTDLFHPEGAGDVVTHVQLGLEADALVIAPASADLIAKLAHGLADDPISTTYLVVRAPVIIAPAMNSNMYSHPATQENIARLKARGCIFVGPEEGRLATGHVGRGRFSETDKILAALEAALRQRAAEGEISGSAWQGRRVLVTAGGTREPLDPVRYIGNRSSGKMGLAIAAEAVRRGAAVTVVLGTVDPKVYESFLNEVTPAGGQGQNQVEIVRAETAEEMLQAVMACGLEQDVVVMAAAVADFRPKQYSEEKIKRRGDPDEELTLTLVPNPDILATLGRAKLERGSNRPFLVGFAAESGEAVSRATAKLARKPGTDLLVANDVSTPGAGFGVDTNIVTLLFPDGTTEAWPLMTKREIAARLLDLIAQRIE
ncbi:MAG: bifunctional phosphopantothenoylcysteine decarboxylase/phosphopantothenate--cysteine ligase CoaBC [Limnochordales bacterium]|nr:bifunctional phosphopantothenoylcysteine decarboxylase/phosphopantothenate--cysteine ligase CoaBC [Limnochordales bacterium]